MVPGAGRRQRGNPEITIPPAGTTATPVLLQHQPLRIVIVIRPPVAAGGRGAAPIGIQHTQPQHIVRHRPYPPPVPFQRITHDRPGLILAAQPGMQRELKPVRVSADAADRHRHLIGADHYHLTRD